VVRIERKDDPHTISNKWFDFSYSTVSQLIQQGIDDVMKTLVSNFRESKDDALEKFIDVVNKEEKNEVLFPNRATQLRTAVVLIRANYKQIARSYYALIILRW
jgi:BMFP domain-containing protein YqiC